MVRGGEAPREPSRRARESIDPPPEPVVAVEGDELVFSRYPYAPAEVHPEGRISAADLAELVANWSPPAVRTGRGEFLFLPPDALEEVRAWAETQGVPVVRRVDVWALLLAPFMDVPMNRAARKEIMRALRRSGFSPLAVWWIRWRVSVRVEFVHCVHFRWRHFGLADVLDATQPLRSKKGFARFYRRAMDLAALGEDLGDAKDPAAPLRHSVGADEEPGQAPLGSARTG